ncbi:MAG: nicotinamide-nucleotide amidohydrolase family protein [Haloarculaceae archaeon]
MDAHAADPPVEKRVGDALRAAGETVAVAEAATGGLVGALLTASPGASDYLDRSYVTYSYDSLREVLAVPRETLDEHGAVSGPAAAAMARAARDRARTDWGLGVAGVAGPGGGTDDRPVGTCIVGVARAAPWESGDSETTTERRVLDGERRADRRERFARTALGDLLEAV